MNLRLGKITLSLSYPLVGIMTAVLLLDTSMNMLICFAAAVMHECGHLAALWHYGTPPEAIRLTLFHIAIVDSKKHLHPFSHELVIVLAGVFINFTAAIGGFILYQVTQQPLWQTFSCAHLTLGAFNSLPADSLDGGQALMLLLTRRFSPDTAERLLTVISVLILIPTACLGFYILLLTKYHFTLLLCAMYLTAVLLLKK